jgi:hypothetical protein
MSGILDGLVLCHLFDPKVLDRQELERNLKLCLSEILQTGSGKNGQIRFS